MKLVSCSGLCSFGLYFLKERGTLALLWRPIIIIIIIIVIGIAALKPSDIKDVLLLVY